MYARRLRYRRAAPRKRNKYARLAAQASAAALGYIYGNVPGALSSWRGGGALYDYVNPKARLLKSNSRWRFKSNQRWRFGSNVGHAKKGGRPYKTKPYKPPVGVPHQGPSRTFLTMAGRRHRTHKRAKSFTHKR